MAEQTDCCRHESRYLCGCPQGLKSHAMPDDGEECDCGAITMSEEAWRNCSGLTHVFHPGDAHCGCGKRSAAMETA